MLCEVFQGLRPFRGRRWAPAGALAFTAVLSLGSPGRPLGAPDGPLPVAAPAAPASAASRLDSIPCPAGTLPDGDACVRLPDAAEAAGKEGQPEAESNVNAHRDRLGRWVVYDEIPRRPDRPAAYEAYRYPVPCEPAGPRGCVVSGYDLDRSDDRQRRGERLRQVGHGAVDLLEPRGTPITAVALENQQGDAEVVYVGPIFGTTVVTQNTLREGGQLRGYLLFFGHLEASAPGLCQGSRLREGERVGSVGDTGSPGRVHLHLEARRLRDGVDPAKLTPSAMLDPANTVVCDPRNVLPLR